MTFSGQEKVQYNTDYNREVLYLQVSNFVIILYTSLLSILLGGPTQFSAGKRTDNINSPECMNTKLHFGIF